MTTSERFPTGSQPVPGTGVGDRFPVPHPLRGGTGPEPHIRALRAPSNTSTGSLVVMGSYRDGDTVDTWVREVTPQRSRRGLKLRRVTWSRADGWACTCQEDECAHIVKVREGTGLGRSLVLSGGTA